MVTVSVPVSYGGHVIPVVLQVELEYERERSDGLLHNLLPSVVVRELKVHGVAGIAPQTFREASVLFTDIKSFTVFSSTVSPSELVAILNILFSAFDRIADRYGVYKVR